MVQVLEPLEIRDRHAARVEEEVRYHQHSLILSSSIKKYVCTMVRTWILVFKLFL
jgi:hypothetical protein